MRVWWTRLRTWLSGRSGLEQDLAEELDSHLEMETADRVERGMAPGEARAAAVRQFGNKTRIAELARDTWTIPSLESLVKDVRYALRSIRRAPSFSLVVILTLALGIGLNTAIFSVVHAVLLKPLPYPQSERLVWLGESTAKVQGFSVSWVNFQHWKSANKTFEDLAAFQYTRLTLTGRGEPLMTRGLVVTSDYYQLLGMRPLLGRLPMAQDDHPGAVPTIVLSHRFWVDAMGGDPKIVGSALTLDGKAYEVVGVAASILETRPVDYYLPLGLQLGSTVDRGRHDSMRVLGLLKPGVSLQAARADIDGIMVHLAAIDPGPESDHRCYGRFLTEGVGGAARGSLLVLLGAAALVLLIACANVAALVLARNTTRASEFGIRTAIGAGHFRLLRQLLTENLVLAAIGGVCGVLLAHWALSALLTLAPVEIPRLAETSINSTVLWFACLLTLCTGLLAGLAPAMAARRLDVSSLMKDGARSMGGSRDRQSVRSVLVIAEVALTLVLAFGSGLLLQSLMAAQNAPTGFDGKHVLTAGIRLPDSAYRTGAARLDFHSRLTANLRALPGVEDVAAVCSAPGMGECKDWFYSVLGRPAPPRNEVSISLFNVASPGFFPLLRIPIRQGRDFTEADAGRASDVAIVNEAFARKWWPKETAIGQRIKVGGPYIEGPELEIVGVVGDAKQGGLDSTIEPEIYQPLTAAQADNLTFLIRVSGDPAAFSGAVRGTVTALDRNLPVQRLAALDQAMGDSLARRRFSTLLLSLFAGLAMLLAAVGVYGLLSYWVNVREAEIAVRLALGAQPAEILSWASGHALRLAAVGVLCGGFSCWIGARLLDDLVYGIPPRDPRTLLAAAAAVGAVAIAAAAIPAWRASRVNAASRLYRS